MIVDMAAPAAPFGRHVSRYYNQSLQPQYDRALLTPVAGSYTVRKTITPCAYRGLTHTLIKTPVAPLATRLMADAFQPLTVASSSILVPSRPCFAPFPTNVKKRKMNAMVQKKTDLSDGEHYRAYKVRLHPTPEQTEVLRTWMAAKRLFYNETVAAINHHPWDEEQPGYSEFREHVRTNVNAMNPWVEDVRTTVKAAGSAAAWEAYQTNLAKHRLNPNHRFRLQFQSLRRLDITPTEVVSLGPPGLNKNGNDTGQCLLNGFFPAASTRKVGGSRMDMECRLMGGMPGTIRAADSTETVMRLLSEKRPTTTPLILWEKRTHRWYLILRRVVTRPPDTRPTAEREVLALDPGARKFAAFYRSDGTHGELLRGADSYIQKQCRKADLERSRTDTAANHDQWHRHRGRMLRTFARIRNWTRNAHYEAIKSIFTLADFIVAPIFESQRMVRRAERVFGNDTARRLYTWSHYGFSQRLYSKVQTTTNKQMAFTREPGTSKTCDRCGAWNAALGGSETFTCRACAYEADRDHHASRGNLLAALGAAMNVGPVGVER